jgi:hypothetical protein
LPIIVGAAFKRNHPDADRCVAAHQVQRVALFENALERILIASTSSPHVVARLDRAIQYSAAQIVRTS